MAGAIKLWYEQAASGSQKELSAIKEEAKNHLLATGWKIWSGDKGTRKELRYTSPTGTVYYSLRKACKSMMEKEELLNRKEAEAKRKGKNRTPPPIAEDCRSPEQPRAGPKHNKKPTKPPIKRTGLRVRGYSGKKQAELAVPAADEDRSDRVCSVCNYGREVLCCAQCPAAFHVQCLGMKTVPEGDWFCYACRCGFCGRRASDSESSSSEKRCEQCERRFHLHCIREMDKLGARNHQRKWFCRKSCNKVFSGLQKLIGKPIRIDDSQGLTWTLFRKRGDSGDVEKLSIALELMHECFDSITDPSSGRDLIEDVMLSKESELKRLDFKGFYTILLEREDEVISVANVRVYGPMVAEMPLVATRWDHRGHGMCRILVKELEKHLRRLGVERLVIPAVPGMLGAWTNKFGFTVMTAPERLKLHQFTFLDFQRTIMCQKMLDS